MKVKQDPEYLKNQSRRIHAVHRRNWRLMKGFMVVWSVVFLTLLLAAVFDLLLDLGWHYRWRDVGTFILFLLGGVLILGFQRVVQEILLGVARRMYGPDPGHGTEA